MVRNGILQQSRDFEIKMFSVAPNYAGHCWERWVGGGGGGVEGDGEVGKDRVGKRGEGEETQSLSKMVLSENAWIKDSFEIKYNL